MKIESIPTAELEGRQGRVLSLVLGGQSDRQIAETLSLSMDTVTEHLARLERVATDTHCLDLAARLSAARGDVPNAPPAMAADAGPPTERRPVRRVLLADDHHINHLTIQAMLEDRRIEVITAFDGAEAVEKFKAGGFDRVLMDIDMPIMDGMAAVRAIRTFESERGGRPTPIAMFTALSGRDIEEAAREAGAIGMNDSRIRMKMMMM